LQAGKEALRVAAPKIEDPAQHSQLTGGDLGSRRLEGMARQFALGMIEKDLRLGEPPVQGGDARFGQQQLRVVRLDLKRQEAQQTRQTRELLPVVKIMPALRHKVSGGGRIATGEGVVECLFDQSVSGEPDAGAPV
jgi:hypothetical protein